jgi:hypothetical protein
MLVERLSTYTCSRMLHFCIPYVIGGSWAKAGAVFRICRNVGCHTTGCSLRCSVTKRGQARRSHVGIGIGRQPAPSISAPFASQNIRRSDVQNPSRQAAYDLLVLPVRSASAAPGSGSVTYLLFFPLCSFASISAWAIDSSAWVMASFACCSASLACASPVPLMDSSM